MLFEYKNIHERRSRACKTDALQPFIPNVSAYSIWVDLSKYKLPSGATPTGFGNIDLVSHPDNVVVVSMSIPSIVELSIDGTVLFGDMNNAISGNITNGCFYLQITLTDGIDTVVLRTDVYTSVANCTENCTFYTVSSYLNEYDCLDRFIGQNEATGVVFSNELLLAGDVSLPIPKYDFGNRIDECTNGSTKVLQTAEIQSIGISYLAMQELAAVLSAGTFLLKQIALNTDGSTEILGIDKWTIQTTEPFSTNEFCMCDYDFLAELTSCACEIDTCATQGCGVAMECRYELYDTQVFQAIGIEIEATNGFYFRFATAAIRDAYFLALSSSPYPIIEVSGLAVPFYVLRIVPTIGTSIANSVLDLLVSYYIPECLDGITPQILNQDIYDTLISQTIPITLTVSRVRLIYTPIALPIVVGFTPTITGFSYDNSALYPTMVAQVGNELVVQPYTPTHAEGLMNLTATVDTGFCSGGIVIKIQE